MDGAQFHSAHGTIDTEIGADDRKRPVAIPPAVPTKTEVL